MNTSNISLVTATPVHCLSISTHPGGRCVLYNRSWKGVSDGTVILLNGTGARWLVSSALQHQLTSYNPLLKYDKHRDMVDGTSVQPPPEEEEEKFISSRQIQYRHTKCTQTPNISPIVSSCHRSNSPLSAAELVRLPLHPSGTGSLSTSSTHLLYSHFNIIWKLSCSDVHFRTFWVVNILVVLAVMTIT